jgi:hypothetical protein
MPIRRPPHFTLARFTLPTLFLIVSGNPNFAQFRPRKSTINLEINVPQSDDIDKKIDESGLESLEYSTRWERYRLTLHKEDIAKHKALLKELMQAAHQSRSM